MENEMLEQLRKLPLPQRLNLIRRLARTIARAWAECFCAMPREQATPQFAFPPPPPGEN